MPAISNVGASGNQDIDALLSTVKWTSPSLTYSFPTSGDFYEYGDEADSNFGAMTANGIAATRIILTWFTSISNLTFSEMTETATAHATIRFARAGGPDGPSVNSAFAYYPDDVDPHGGDAWFNRATATMTNPTLGSFGWTAIAHELGHALGLKHGHETDEYGALPADHNSNEYSIMTYASYVGSPADGYSIGNGSGPQSLMQDDIAALQYMYGANFNFNNGNTTYTWNSGTGQMSINSVGQGTSTSNKVFITIWDGGGTDTYNLSNYSSNLTVDLDPGAWTITSSAQLATLNGGSNPARGNIANALLYQGNTASLIENATAGSGDDTLRGNVGNNHLIGGSGTDLLDGRTGNDILDGGSGFDTVDYALASSGISVNLANGSAQAIGGGMGSDTLTGIERVIGSNFNDTFAGDSDANTLDGGSGTDRVSYAGAASGVTVNLSIAGAQSIGGGQGSDTLNSIENLTGSNFGDSLVGIDGVNVLNGGDGGDTLAGAGGADDLFGEGGNDSVFGGLGLDNMFGGDGDDLLYVADNDGTIEGGIGYDQVIVLTASGVTLTIGSGVEYVAGNSGLDVLSAAGTTTAITIGGSLGNDIITGGEGGDTLAGMEDNDTINGMGGNDQLFAGAGVDNFFGGDGDDLIYILGNDGTIEGGIGFDQAIVLDTNGVSITLGSGMEYGAGNAGNDSINGSGLSVALTLGGAGGDDTVTGGSVGDTLSGSTGIDTIFGNNGGDVIFGGDDNDLLYGGEGNDQLFGGNGSDVMFIEDASGTDSVSGFNDGLDIFDFSLHSTVTSFADLLVSTLGGDALVDFDGGQLFIAGAAGLIDSSDFLFA